MKHFFIAMALMFSVLAVSHAKAPSPKAYIDKVLVAWNASIDHNNDIIDAFDKANTGKEFAALKKMITEARRVNQKHLDQQTIVLNTKNYPDDARQLQTKLVAYLDAAVVELDAFLVLANNPPKRDSKFIDHYNEIIDHETKDAEDLMDEVDAMIDDYAAKHNIKI